MGSPCGGGWFFCSRGLYLGGQAGGPNGGAVWEDGDAPSVGVTVWGGGWGKLGSTYYFSEGLLCGTLGH